MTEYPGLTPAHLPINPKVETAQRFVAAAYDSVAEFVIWHETALRLAEDMAEEETVENRDLAALTSNYSSDLLRSMIVFGTAGLDAALKQLIRDCLPTVLNISSKACDRFVKFTEREIDSDRSAGKKNLAQILTSADPRRALIDRYVTDLRGSSLQSVGQVQNVAEALGIEDQNLRRRITQLRPSFDARNEIVHELDLLGPATHGDKQRRLRSLDQAIRLSHESLDVAQQIVNAVAVLLPSHRDRTGE